MRTSKVFISYNNKERQLAKSISRVIDHFGYDVWLDESQMLGGDKITNTVRQQIRKTDFFIVLLSKASIASKWVKLEIAEALQAGESLHILPILSEHCDVPESLDDFLYIDLCTAENYESGIQQSIEAMELRNNEVWKIRKLSVLRAIA